MDMTFPDDIEVAPKGDAHCKKCHEKIYKGDVRLRENRYDIKYHSVNSYVCRKCIPKYMADIEQKAKNLYIKMAGIVPIMKELVKQNKKQIKINDGLRKKEKLVQEIEYGNKKEAWNARGIRL